MDEIKREFAHECEMIKQKSGLDPIVIETERNVMVKRCKCRQLHYHFLRPEVGN
jgi:hypothetical protein